MRLCLDTSAYSQFKRGHAAAVEALSSARSIVVPVIVLGELRAGFRQGARRGHNEAELQAFLDHPVVQVGEIGDDTASLFADLVVELRRAGTPIPTNDIWIAAVALREAAPVLTFDQHFSRIPRGSARVLAL